MMRLFVAFSVLLMAGCQSFYEQPVPLSEKPILYRDVMVRMERTNYDFPEKKQNGMAVSHTHPITGVRHCALFLRDYPRFLGHEMDHCFRGSWHEDRDNGDDFN